MTTENGCSNNSNNTKSTASSGQLPPPSPLPPVKTMPNTTEGLAPCSEVYRGRPTETIYMHGNANEDGTLWSVGWTKVMRQRMETNPTTGATNKTSGRIDSYWITPTKKYRLRSFVDVQHFVSILRHGTITTATNNNISYRNDDSLNSQCCNGDEETAKKILVQYKNMNKNKAKNKNMTKVGGDLLGGGDKDVVVTGSAKTPTIPTAITPPTPMRRIPRKKHDQKETSGMKNTNHHEKEEEWDNSSSNNNTNTNAVVGLGVAVVEKKDIHGNDVLYGPGVTYHVGNVQYRNSMNTMLAQYSAAGGDATATATKNNNDKDSMMKIRDTIASNIVYSIRSKVPSGRFLVQQQQRSSSTIFSSSSSSSLWYDIGNDEAIINTLKGFNVLLSSPCKLRTTPVTNTNELQPGGISRNSNSTDGGGVDTIDDNDVLCGLGLDNDNKDIDAIYNHIGNFHYRNSIQSMKEEFITATTIHQKASIATTIVNHIRLLGGRFLHQPKSTSTTSSSLGSSSSGGGFGLVSLLWFDIGNDNAITKTMQELSESGVWRSTTNARSRMTEMDDIVDNCSSVIELSSDDINNDEEMKKDGINDRLRLSPYTYDDNTASMTVYNKVDGETVSKVARDRRVCIIKEKKRKRDDNNAVVVNIHSNDTKLSINTEIIQEELKSNNDDDVPTQSNDNNDDTRQMTKLFLEDCNDTHNSNNNTSKIPSFTAAKQWKLIDSLNGEKKTDESEQHSVLSTLNRQNRKLKQDDSYHHRHNAHDTSSPSTLVLKRNLTNQKVYNLCKENKWEKILTCLIQYPYLSTENIMIDNTNHPVETTSIIHEAIVSIDGNTKDRKLVIETILNLFPVAAQIPDRTGLLLPIHAILLHNSKGMDWRTKECLIKKIAHAHPAALLRGGGIHKRTPLHMLFRSRWLYSFYLYN